LSYGAIHFSRGLSKDFACKDTPNFRFLQTNLQKTTRQPPQKPRVDQGSGYQP